MVKVLAPQNFAESKYRVYSFESERSARNIVQLKPITKLALTSGKMDLTETLAWEADLWIISFSQMKNNSTGIVSTPLITPWLYPGTQEKAALCTFQRQGVLALDAQAPWEEATLGQQDDHSVTERQQSCVLTNVKGKTTEGCPACPAPALGLLCRKVTVRTRKRLGLHFTQRVGWQAQACKPPDKHN